MKPRVSEDWCVIQDEMNNFEQRMREAVNDPNEGKRKCESTWEISKINHQRSRYVYEGYMNNKVSKKLYEHCVDRKLVDDKLIAKWKKPGYEHLCCLSCIQTRDHNFGTCCICRVPRANRDVSVLQCVTCGCTGCASGD